MKNLKSWIKLAKKKLKNRKNKWNEKLWLKGKLFSINNLENVGYPINLKKGREDKEDKIDLACPATKN